MEQLLTLSPLQLRQLLFTRVSVEALYPMEDAAAHWAPTYDFADTEVQLNVELGEREGSDGQSHTYRMGIDLKISQPAEDASHIPYAIDIAAKAWFTLADTGMSADQRRSIVEVNGASMIISAIRDEIARITARSILGMLTLPTLRIIPASQRSKVAS
jgi:hypothetical protein